MGRCAKSVEETTHLLSSLLDASGVGVDIRVLPRAEAKHMIVDAAELPEEEEQEEGARDNIEDTVPDHLRARRDDVRALSESPADRVSDEHEREVCGGKNVALAERASLGERAAGCLPEEGEPNEISSELKCAATESWDIPDVDESTSTEDIVTPLVVAGHQCTNQAADDKDDSGEGSENNVRDREAGCEQELKQQERQGYEPLDVSHVLEYIKSDIYLKAVKDIVNLPKLDASHLEDGTQ